MKVTTQPATLAAAVKFAARAPTARAAYPILGGLKITASPGGVEVAAFDYETSARARIDAEVGEPGTVLAPGRLLADIAARLPPRQPAELAAGDEGALTLAAGSTRWFCACNSTAVVRHRRPHRRGGDFDVRKFRPHPWSVTRSGPAAVTAREG